MKYAGLDIGTTTISGVLLDVESGVCLKAITLANTAHFPENESRQAPEKIFGICQAILTQLSQNYGKPDGLGLTGQMHGILYIDAQGEAVSPLFSWQDGRGDLPFKDERSYAAHLSSLTGFAMATGYGLTTHYYNLVNNLVPSEAVSMVTIPDYVAMRLCGLAEPVLHPSMAHSLGMFDLPTGQFDTGALQAAGINRELLPQVDTEDIMVGRTANEVPVAIPIGDNQASFLGSVKPGINVLLNIGTGSQISVLSESIQDLPPLETRPYIKSKYLLAGSALCGGSAYNLLHQFFNQVMGDLGGMEPQNLYEQMASLGERVYSTENPLEVDTRFKGTRADPKLRGAIHNLGLENFTPGSLVAGFLGGMVAELKSYYDRLPDSLKESELIAGSGNAIRRNVLLRRIIEDQFRKRLYIPPYEEEAAMGAAIFTAKRMKV